MVPNKYKKAKKNQNQIMFQLYLKHNKFKLKFWNK